MGWLRRDAARPATMPYAQGRSLSRRAFDIAKQIGAVDDGAQPA
jgi:hypothetical protein